MDNQNVNRATLSKYTKQLAKEYWFAGKLNAMSRQASAERAWSSIARFYDNCKKKVPGKKGYPRFKKNSRLVDLNLSVGNSKTQNTFNLPTKTILVNLN